MSDEIEVLKIVSSRLNGASIPYMLTGSMAMNYYAQPRMTRDIDIVIELPESEASRLSSLFSADFLCEEEAIRSAVRIQGMFNIIHSTLIVKVDFVVRKNEPYRLAEFARRRFIEVDNQAISIVAPEDLLLSKLDWAKPSRSELQLDDVRNLISTVGDLDWEYIDRWAGQLEVADILAEVRR